MKAMKICADGTTAVIEIANELEALQQAVGGHIEVVHLPTDDDLLIVDEEGLIKDREPNKLATLLAQQPIVGDVLIVSKNGEDFGDVDPQLCIIVAQMQGSIKGKRLFSRTGPVNIKIDDRDFRMSKHKELAVRSHFCSEEKALEELQAMINVCIHELFDDRRLCREDLYLYCTAMQNVITSLETQMDDWQKRTYKALCESSKITTFVCKEGEV